MKRQAEEDISIRTGNNRAIDPYQIYMKEAGAVALLTLAEEREVCQRLAEGDAQAAEHLVRANLRLVIMFAKGYARKYGASLPDLIQEGNIGLMHALEKYELSRGYRFATYAGYWIKQFIQRACGENLHQIRLPTHVIEKMFELRRTRDELTKELGRKPTNEEVRNKLGWPKETYKLIRDATRLKVLEGNRPKYSEDGEEEFFDSIAAPDDTALLEKAWTRKTIAGALDELSKTYPRGAIVLRLRFALGDESERPLKLREIGEKLGVTRERARQIETRALAKLKSFLSRSQAM